MMCFALLYPSLYHHPANLFVAGFIGSPGMNLLPARIEDSRMVLPTAEVQLPASFSVEADRVVAGFRPEHLQQITPEDGTPDGLVFEATVDVVEWLGAELYVYFDVLCPKAWLVDVWPDELNSNIRDDGVLTIIARLDPSTSLHKGDKILLGLDTNKIQLFDVQTAKALD